MLSVPWRQRLTCATLATFYAVGAPAQEAPPDTQTPTQAAPKAALDRVEIRARRSDTDQRRQSTAAKTVVGRDEIDKYGDASVTDVLQRLPGVTLGGTPGRGGEISLRGLGAGYTQILVNGERMPAGFSLDTLTPAQIERIEVMRAPTAEFGAQAIAGTINIVLREDARTQLNTLALGTSMENGRQKPSATWTHADRRDDLDYNVSATVFRQSWLDRSSSRIQSQPAGQPVSERIETSATRTHRAGLNANARLQWKLDGGQSFSLSPYLFYSQADSDSHSEVSPATAPPYAATRAPDNRSFYGISRTTAQWQLRPGEGAKLDIKLGGHLSQWGSDTLRQEYGAGQPAPLTRLYINTPRARDNGLATSGKYTLLLGDDHQLAAGWALDTVWRRETQNANDRGIASAEDVSARRTTSALWAQDEWTVSPQWSLHAGLRWERIDTRSDWLDDQGLPTQVGNASSVWSPLLHALWKPDEDSRDRWRLSLTRSYKPPTTQQLVARRGLSRTYAVDQPNTPTSPDRLGNPSLLPELATGIDLAWEHYVGDNGVVSVGLFHRQIKNLIRTVTSDSAQAVPWSPALRYVSQPVNLASATTSGLELEAKVRANDVWAAAPPVDLRGNVSLFRSRVASLPGPYNTLDRQPGYTGNVGADYKLRSLPLTVGTNLNYTPAYTTQQSDQLQSGLGVRRVLDAYAQWTVSPKASLRLSANNLMPLNSRSSVAYLSPDYTERSDTLEPSNTTLSVRLELRL